MAVNQAQLRLMRSQYASSYRVADKHSGHPPRVWHAALAHIDCMQWQAYGRGRGEC
jgi:hypothetical protein